MLPERKTQLWLLSDNTKPPLDNSAEKEFDSDKTNIFDRFHYPTKYDGMSCCIIDSYTEPSKNASLDKFAEELKKHPASKGYLIFYGQYCTDCSSSAVYSRNGKYLGVKPDIYLDSSKTVARILRREKNYLLKRQNISASNIITINGGYREWQEIELWIVPKGGEIPKPKPNYFPKKIKKLRLKR